MIGSESEDEVCGDLIIGAEYGTDETATALPRERYRELAAGQREATAGTKWTTAPAAKKLTRRTSVASEPPG